MEPYRSDGSHVARVAQRMLDRLPPLVSRMGQVYRAEVPEYAALDDTEIEREVLPVSRAVVEVFFGAMASGRAPDAADVPGLEEMGRRRLEMGIHLEAMLHVYRIAGRAVFDGVVASIEPGEEKALGEIGARWMEYMDQCSSRAASGYMAASDERVRRVEARRGAVLQALIGANDAAEVAAVASELALSLAATYAPVLAGTEQEHLDTLLHASPAGSLAGYRGSALLVLAPDAIPDLARIRHALGDVSVVWGEPAPPGPALRAEVERAERVLSAALARGITGVLGPDDLVVEQLVLGNRRVAASLERTVLTQLRKHDGNGVLRATLRSYLETGSIPDTARREVVHPNTIGYRLRRIYELTNLDPRVPSDAAVLVLALAAADLT